MERNKLLTGLFKALKETFKDFTRAFLIMIGIAVLLSLSTTAFQYYLIKNNVGKIVMPDGVHSSVFLKMNGETIKWTDCKDVNPYKEKKITYKGLSYIVKGCREVIIGGIRLSEVILKPDSEKTEK